ELFRECSHYCELVSTPEQIPQVLAVAMRKAVINRGVSVVVLPGDVALKAAPESASSHWYHAPLPISLDGMWAAMASTGTWLR
ncbi:hypothetical protein GXB74_26450, partial [Klebsiella pneumoniae]|nr:hypothetical protein [Klebsiella pneumoniae]